MALLSAENNGPSTPKVDSDDDIDVAEEAKDKFEEPNNYISPMRKENNIQKESKLNNFN